MPTRQSTNWDVCLKNTFSSFIPWISSNLLALLIRCQYNCSNVLRGCGSLCRQFLCMSQHWTLFVALMSRAMIFRTVIFYTVWSNVISVQLTITVTGWSCSTCTVITYNRISTGTTEISLSITTIIILPHCHWCSSNGHLQQHHTTTSLSSSLRPAAHLEDVRSLC